MAILTVGLIAPIRRSAEQRNMTDFLPDTLLEAVGAKSAYVLVLVLSIGAEQESVGGRGSRTRALDGVARRCDAMVTVPPPARSVLWRSSCSSFSWLVALAPWLMHDGAAIPPGPLFAVRALDPRSARGRDRPALLLLCEDHVVVAGHPFEIVYRTGPRTLAAAGRTARRTMSRGPDSLRCSHPLPAHPGRTRRL